MAKSVYCAVALMALSGCPTSECPSGSVMVEGRCVEVDSGSADIDAATDARARNDANTDAFSIFDAWAPDAGNDAWEPDAFVVPDSNCGCTGNLICVAGAPGGCGCIDNTQCGGATPACDTSTHTCVPCVDNSTCTAAGARACDLATHTCVACVDNITCTDTANPVCRTDTHTCVPCTDGASGACMGTTPACASNACVECSTMNTSRCMGTTTPSCDTDNTCTCTSTSCTSATAARCNTTTNDCEACMGDGDCTNVAGNPRCVSGVCRPCNVLTEASDCPGTSCNPATHACSSTLVHMTGRCQPCTFDSQCAVGDTCAAVNPSLGNSGNYCLPIRVTACSALRPYAQGVDGDPTDLGGTVNYCRPRTTTCEAVLHHASPQVQGSDRCTNVAPAGTSDAACGAASISDGLCRSTGGDNYCTYPCATGTDNDCRSGFTCVPDATVPGYGARCSI